MRSSCTTSLTKSGLPACLAVHRRGEGLGSSGAGDELDEPVDVRLGEPGERQPPSQWQPGELDDHCRERVVACQLGIAVTGDHEEVGVRELVRHEAQEQKGGGVCCVEVVEEQDDRLLRRGALEE